MEPGFSETDRRLMAAAIRYAERHAGLTGTNPSVATLIVRFEGGVPLIVGRGVTAVGGRPHAETVALAEAGALARGACAYVTLEPCAHHGRTPPCAEALVAAGIARVVSAAADPDPRVDGRGHDILRAAGIEVAPGLLAREARETLSGYLARALRKRPEVTLKMALSADGMLGRRGQGRVAITGPVANAQTHLMRARSEAILVGIGTVLADDPALTCRLPGLEERSPMRIVVDPRLETPPTSRLGADARGVPTVLAALAGADPQRGRALREAGFEFLAAEPDENGRVALPELLDDLGARGISTLMVEGGAMLGGSFLKEDLVDRLVLVVAPGRIGEGGVPAPLDPQEAGHRFDLRRQLRYGDDLWLEYMRKDG
ncbi:bifunctional diaminohydroxyphosphoribosylaminopyrimidine deaminase/5-amino-6-(5-phosphoribosylamino)uracil reductase RibD [Aureimonas populi]|uniref:Riboflavin biosynthesis protein RibD n=1 Tax=Aureimonas populi TaxID=1701758 RepID=A0ABW5CFJ8_9HYPH|nr:bifunctional diaminohydroxyphosphoribosylaminopyrimidine deaminase/5-amino-6-(5-phosphoribosylamino)uracil reductase RibD [Aureimonas populi]